MTSEVTSRSDAKIAKKIRRASERKEGKERAWRELLLTEPTEAPRSLAAPPHRRAARLLAQRGAMAWGHRSGGQLTFLAPVLCPSS